MPDKERDTAIQQGQKDGGPQQPNQGAQGELGEQRHQGGGVRRERKQQGGPSGPAQQQGQNPGQTGTPGGKRQAGRATKSKALNAKARGCCSA